MTIPPGEGDDLTVRSASSTGRGGPGDPTIPARRGTRRGDPTVPADSGGTGGVPPGGGWDSVGDEPPDRRLGVLLGGIALAGVLLGVLIALLVGGGGTSQTSSTTTSSSPTTAPAGAPQILQFVANQTNPPCTQTTQIRVTWSTQNAQSVALVVDGTSVGVFNPTGSALVAFSCPPASHTYRLTANGANAQRAMRTIVVTNEQPGHPAGRKPGHHDPFAGPGEGH